MSRILPFFLSFLLTAAPAVAAESLKIGFNLELTGDIPDVGDSSKKAAELVRKRLAETGGLEIGGKKYKVEFLYEDNESKAESAVTAATKLVSQDEVLALVGPQASKQAVPAGEIAESLRTPMISPWSTNPAATAGRAFVFRACFLDPFQGPVVAKFATEELKAKKAAVLYDVSSDYPKGLAEFFKKSFETINGPGSVVAFETFTTKDVDFGAQLTAIAKSGADVLFTPQYYNEVPLIVKQARALGFKGPIVGSDSWGGGKLMELCGDACKGLYFSTHYAAAGATGATKEFIDAYKTAYGKTPDDVAALTFDAVNILFQAIKTAGQPSGALDADREKVRDALAKTKDFNGITGRMTFSGSGDPVKCAVVVKINEQGEFAFHKSVCP